jgi:hypothetical protein
LPADAFVPAHAERHPLVRALIKVQKKACLAAHLILDFFDSMQMRVFGGTLP